MAKTPKTQYVCQQCGRSAPKPLGRCPQCGAWNSMVAEAAEPRRRQAVGGPRRASRPLRLGEIEGGIDDRLSLPMGEFARVLGGGIVPGSLILIGGDPGIGKSTLLLQMALLVAKDRRVLYVSGEESEPQIKSRAMRLAGAGQGALPDELYLATETNLEVILHTSSPWPRRWSSLTRSRRCTCPIWIRRRDPSRRCANRLPGFRRSPSRPERLSFWSAM